MYLLLHDELSLTSHNNFNTIKSTEYRAKNNSQEDNDNNYQLLPQQFISVQYQPLSRPTSQDIAHTRLKKLLTPLHSTFTFHHFIFTHWYTNICHLTHT